MAKNTSRSNKNSSDLKELENDESSNATATEEGSRFADKAEESAIDDPVRMYLMQMGRIPLLTRDEEVDAATKIDAARFEFRNTMLATDFMLKGAYDSLYKVSTKQLRLDRTIEVSVTNKAEKERIMQRIGPNLETLKHLLIANQSDYLTSINKTENAKSRKAAWERLTRRRNKCVRLVEELNLRYSKLQPLFDQLQQINIRMQQLHEQLNKTKEPDYVGSSYADIKSELNSLMLQTFESPATLKRRVEKTNALAKGSGRCQTYSFGRQPATGRFDC